MSDELRAQLDAAIRRGDKYKQELADARAHTRELLQLINLAAEYLAGSDEHEAIQALDKALMYRAGTTQPVRDISEEWGAIANDGERDKEDSRLADQRGGPT